MASGNTTPGPQQPSETTSGNTRTRSGARLGVASLNNRLAAKDATTLGTIESRMYAPPWTFCVTRTHPSADAARELGTGLSPVRR